MNNTFIKDEVVIENLIYEIRGKQVMLDSKIAVTKCHNYFYGKVVTHYDIGNPISMLINFADMFAKLERR